MRIRLTMAMMAIAGPVAAANFTACTGAGSDWLQKKEYMNELHTAYREHLLVVSQSVVNAAAFQVGTDVQKASIWSNMQSFCLNEYDQFVNHTFTSPTGVVTLGGTTWYTNGIGSLYNTLGEFLKVAGITNGFRRATAYDPAVNTWRNYNDAMYSYGYCKPGDIEGPWLREDLIKAFSALKWTRKREDTSSGASTEFQYWDGVGNTASGYGITYSQATNDWAGNTWASGSGGHGGSGYWCRRYATHVSGSTWGVSEWRIQSKLVGQVDVGPMAIKSNMTYDLDVYLIDKNATNGYVYAGDFFVDMDGLGFSVNQWKLIESQAGLSSHRASMADWYGDIDTEPMDLNVGIGDGTWTTTSIPPGTNAVGQATTQDVDADWSLWLIKWNWSYVN